MPNPAIDDRAFLQLVGELGPHEAARRLKINVRGIYSRRRRLEEKHGIRVNGDHVNAKPIEQHPHRLHSQIRNGHVIVASDCHYWPGIVTTAHRGLVHLIRELKPTIVVLNGDVLDGATISRHPPINWESRPSLEYEMDACKERLLEIEKVAKGADLIWTLGNHDSRFETRLATVAPEYARVHGVHLKDHFPHWKPAMSAWVNNDVVIKHRWKGGIHAVHNNTVNAGKTMVTGHLHSAKVTPFSDYNGTRYGVDTGCIAEPYDPQFLYTEDAPANWRSGFGVLTFRDGRLLMPELALRFDKSAIEFRGEVIRV